MSLQSFISAALGVAAAAQGWSPEYDLTADMAGAYGQPSLAFDSTGRLHCVYMAEPPGGEPHIYYRQLVGTVWSTAQDLPGPNYKEPAADMALDGNGNVHVVGIYRVDGTMNTPYTVYYWRYDGTVWTGPVQLSDGQGGDSDNCSFPRIRADKNNNLHVIWAEGNKTGGKGDIMYRRCVGGGWEPPVNLTNNGSPNPYGSANPDLAVDRAPGTTVHVAWQDEFSGYARVYYTKSADLGTVWLPSSEWTQISSDDYGKTPTVCLDRNNFPNLWWTDSASKYLGYRRWTGSTWTPIADWGTGTYFQSGEFDGGNVLRYVYSTGSPLEFYYRTYNYSTFGVPEWVSAGPDTYKCDFARLAMDSSGYVHMVWEERKDVAGTPVGHVYYSTEAPLGPPGPVTSFTATPSRCAITLRWANPADFTFVGTMIRYSTIGFPASPSDGTLLAMRAALPSSLDSLVHGGATNGRTYYYAAFAYDRATACSSAATVAAIPKGTADFDGDADVDLQDFAFFQLCFAGPNRPFAPLAGCDASDTDCDSDVDLMDFGFFQGCFNGPNRAPSC